MRLNMCSHLFTVIGFLTALGILGGCSAKNEAWTNRKTFENPESAYFHAPTGLIFVSNVAGNPTEKDGIGWITTLNKGGKLITNKWVSGLNAPKGMRARGDLLWVSDIDRVIAINIKTGTIALEIPVEGSEFLNDIAIDSSGNIYVSDTFTNKIILIKNTADSGNAFSNPNPTPTVFVDGKDLESPNGLLAVGSYLYVAGWGANINKESWATTAPGRITRIHLENKEQVVLTGRIGNLDGLERTRDGSFLVSDWMTGKVFRIRPDGSSIVIFKTKQGTADIGFIPKTNLFLVPRMLENKVTAVRLD